MFRVILLRLRSLAISKFGKKARRKNAQADFDALAPADGRELHVVFRKDA